MKRDPRKRYSQTGWFETLEGTWPVFTGLLPRKVETQPGYVLHMIVQGDRLDRLAQNYYGDPRLWWAIAQANPGLLSPADILYRAGPKDDQKLLKIGTEIHIPPQPQEAE
jgi:nucleoid-associated protein YgaU